MSQEVKPFIIVAKNGEVMHLLQTNEKGYKKSIENNQLWIIDSETGRLLPQDINEKILSFKERMRWYQVVVEADFNSSEVSEQKTLPESFNLNTSNIIYDLFNVIEQRKKEMPEGSYTTHLFNSGISKIKKKTGEEAVELILAETKDEIVYESCDLIYHMLVFLAASEIKPEELFSELERRK